MNWTVACPLVELTEACPVGVVVDGVEVCLVRLGGQVFAVHDECTHEAVPLSEGDVQGTSIECWRHGSQFDLRTGAVLNPPAVDDVATYRTRIADGQVQVDVGVSSTVDLGG